MDFLGKLHMRSRLLTEFALKGHAASQEILRTSFCEFDESGPSILRRQFDHHALLHPYRAHPTGGYGQKQGFFNPLKPDMLFLNAAYLEYPVKFGDTVQHEHIHFLDWHEGNYSFYETDAKDVRKKYKAPVYDESKIDQALYLTGEDELMPRLDQIVTTFCAMGAKLPTSKMEFEAFLWFCDILYEKVPYEVQKEKHSAVIEHLFSGIDKSRLEKHLRVFGNFCAASLDEIQGGINALKVESLPKMEIILNSAYKRLLDLYGYEMTDAEYEGAFVPQLTIGMPVPILAAQ